MIRTFAEAPLLSKRFLPLACLALVLGCRPAVDDEALPPSNVLLLVIDCLRADRFAAEVPYARAVTPHLDTILPEAIRFTGAFSQSNWTRPSLPTFLTGLYPSEHGLTRLQDGAAAGDGEGLSEDVETVAEALSTAGYATAMVGEQQQLSPRFGLDQGFDHYNHKGSTASSIHHGFGAWVDGAAEPFFAYLHYLELHWPYCPPPDVRGAFTAEWQGRSFCSQWRKLRDDIRSGEVRLDRDEIEAMAAFYDEELLGLDREIGALIADLRERGIWDETLVIITSDHGEEFFEHGAMGHGNSLHDELVHVPLLIKPPASWPGPRGVVVDDLVELRDLAPTILETAGLGARPSSLVPPLRGRTTRGGRPFVTSEDSERIAVRTRDQKLIVSRDGTVVELYDLAVDGGETRNVAATRPEDVDRLLSNLTRWRESLGERSAVAVELDEETLEGLRSLGYLN